MFFVVHFVSWVFPAGQECRSDHRPRDFHCWAQARLPPSGPIPSHFLDPLLHLWALLLHHLPLHCRCSVSQNPSLFLLFISTSFPFPLSFFFDRTQISIQEVTKQRVLERCFNIFYGQNVIGINDSCYLFFYSSDFFQLKFGYSDNKSSHIGKLGSNSHPLV